MNFGFLTDLFLELRGQGASLSTEDLETLRLWQEKGWDPKRIQDTMISLHQDYALLRKPFPNRLHTFHKHLVKIWET